MTEVHNLTPFACLTNPHVDAQGRHDRLLVVKGVWRLNSNQWADQPGALALREEPLALRIGELGLEPAQQQVMQLHLDEEIDWLPSDLCPPKPRFDLLVCGHAYTENGKGEHQFVAGIVHPRHQVALVLRAPRYWKKTLLQGGGGVPDEFLSTVTRVPVHPRFSFGGESSGADDLYNPQGMGSASVALVNLEKPQSLQQIGLPWVEHPDHPVLNVSHTPLPASFGLWGENTGSRAPHFGTRDQAWRQERAPRLPQDFNPIYYNQAEPRLQWPQAPQPGEFVEFHRLTRDGMASLRWPAVRPKVFVDHQAGPALIPDTCVVVPDTGLYAILWRCIVPRSAELTLRVAKV